MNFASIGTTIWGGIKQVPNVVWWIIIAIFTLRFLEMWWRSDEASKQKARQAEETDNNLDQIEARADENVDRAERIREDNPVTGDPDRVSVTPLPDYHYRD